MTAEAKPVFAGLKALDIGSFVAAPAAATMLSDLGAQVIKIEPPGGDPWRTQFTRPGMPTPPGEFDYLWGLAARNKRGLVLNLKTEEGREVLHRLVRETDILVTNTPLKARGKLGLDYETISALNPRLIYASLTGYGEAGPDMHLPGFDATSWWGRSGLMGLIGPEADSPPSRSVSGMGDHLTAVALFGAVATGLYQRERTGRGGLVQTSLMATGAWSNANLLQAALSKAKFGPRAGRSQAHNPLHNNYLCGDGRWLNLSLNLANMERDWPKLIATIEGGALLEDLPIRHFRDLGRHNAEIIEALDRIFLKRSATEWIETLRAARFAVELVPTMEEVAADPQMEAGGHVIATARPDQMALTVNSPVRIEGSPTVLPQPAPGLGEHTRGILAECGFSETEIERFYASNAVA